MASFAVGSDGDIFAVSDFRGIHRGICKNDIRLKCDQVFCVCLQLTLMYGPAVRSKKISTS